MNYATYRNRHYLAQINVYVSNIYHAGILLIFFIRKEWRMDYS